MANLGKVVTQNNFLSNKNANWRTYHQDLATFGSPRKANITTPRITGDRVNLNFLYDQTAVRSVKKFTAGFFSNLTNPATKWYGFTLQNQNRMTKTIEIFFRDCTEIQLAVQSRTNLYNTLKEFFADYGVFGTGTIFKHKDPKTKINYAMVPIEQVNIEDDAHGRTVGLYRNFKLQADQAAMEWGRNAGPAVAEKMKEGKNYDLMDFLHYVGPRDKRNPYMLDSKSMAFESLWIAKQGNGKEAHLMEESGFNRLPYYVGRYWKEATEQFGFSPMMDVLADIKLINACIKTWLRRAMKEGGPAWQVPDKSFALPLNFNSDAINYRDPSIPADAIQPIGISNGSFSITKEFIEYIKDNIEDGFYVKVFEAMTRLAGSGKRTVPEVVQIIQEGMIQLGPIVSQCTYEVLDPLNTDTFFDLLEMGLFPDVPEELEGQEFYPVYESPLALAQRQTSLQSQDQFMARAQGIGSMFPDSLLRLDPDKMIVGIAKTLKVSPEFLRSDSEVKKVMEAKAQMQRAQIQMDTAHKQVAVMETGAKAALHGAKAKQAEAA